MRDSISRNSTGPEWESNKDAKECRLCLKVFSFTIRRHHCRSCGRVVCNPCSNKRLILNQNNDNNDDKPLRVCDDCYGSLTTRKEYSNKTKIRREKAESILQMSSIISDNLLRVFLLDGSFKVVSYDDNTTASELTSDVCFSVKCALFETIDITNADQFKMIAYNEAIINVIARWNLHNVTNAKFMIPVYDIESCSKDNAPPTFRIVKANTNKDLVPSLSLLETDDVVVTPSRKDNAQSPSRTGRIFTKILKIDKTSASTTPINTNSNIATDVNDIEYLKRKLVEVTEKYEMVSSLLAKKGNLETNGGSTSFSPPPSYSTPSKARVSSSNTVASTAVSSSSSSLYKKPSSSAKIVDSQNAHVQDSNVVDVSPYKSLETLQILGRDDVIIATNTDDLSLLLRTFFYQINGIENFCNRYENILKTIIAVPISDSDDIDNDNDSSTISLELIMKNSQIFSQVYEMASALESLFELLQIFSSRFNLNVKRWLLDSLKNSLSLRSTNVEMVASILNCLDRYSNNSCTTIIINTNTNCREKLVVGEEVAAIITNFIDECFYGSIIQAGKLSSLSSSLLPLAIS